MDFIYLDNNASTPLLPSVWEEMRPFFLEEAGNPASSHQAGRRARKALEEAREIIASLLDAHPDEVIFTSGATEANNLAIFGLAGRPPGHVITSAIEHPCVGEPIRQLVEAGFTEELLPVDPLGVVRKDVLADRIDPRTRLVTMMLANHETGALQPVADLAGLVEGRAAFHCDAAAAAGKMPISFRRLGVTTMTISGHKFHGPKGIGALFLKRKTRLRPLLYGGHQQQGRRPGTEPAALAVGLARALELACREESSRRDKVQRLRDQFLGILQAEAGPVAVNSPGPEECLPHTLNVSFPGCQADILLMNLDLAGVACSTGSACSSGSLLPSPVLQAMGLAGDVLGSAMRFSFSFLLSEQEVREAGRRIAAVVQRLRGPR